MYTWQSHRVRLCALEVSLQTLAAVCAVDSSQLVNSSLHSFLLSSRGVWSACALDLMVLLSQTKQGKRQWRKRQRIAEERAVSGAVDGASVVKEESESEEAGLETSEQAVQARPETTEQAVQTD